MTTEDFIARAKQIHGDTYDYSKVKYKNSVSKVEIICREHGSFFQNAGNHINPKIRCGCPYCAGKKVMPGVNDFATLYPEAASEWDYSKNSVLPSEVFPKANKKYYFVCSKGHSYLQSLNCKTSNNGGCPYCSGQALLKGYNDLQTIHPEIAKEWDFSRNVNGPSDYRYGSGYKAWWLCDKCGLSYQSPINVHIRGHKCPYCSGQKVATGKNDLQTLYPEIAREYSDKNSVPVSQISAHTHHKAIWNCPFCGNEYTASINHRTSSGTECPICAKASKGERKVKAVLDELGVSYKQQESFEDLKDKHPLRFDFTIYQNDKLIAVIEFNGIQHYKPRSVFGGEKAFQMQKKHDLMKVQYCVDHGLYLLQIPYKTCECDTEEYVRRLFRNLDTYQKIMENQARWQRSGILHQKLVLDEGHGR